MYRTVKYWYMLNILFCTLWAMILIMLICSGNVFRQTAHPCLSNRGPVVIGRFLRLLNNPVAFWLVEAYIGQISSYFSYCCLLWQKNIHFQRNYCDFISICSPNPSRCCFAGQRLTNAKLKKPEGDCKNNLNC